MINGNKRTAVIVLMDITDRKNKEEDVTRYKILSEKVRDIIHFIDTEGNIIDVNQSGLSSYGYTYEEFLKLNIRDLRQKELLHRNLLKIFIKVQYFMKLFIIARIKVRFQLK